MIDLLPISAALHGLTKHANVEHRTSNIE